MKVNKRKQNTILTLIAGLILIVLINLLGSRFYTRLDLTSEKRYSLSDATKEVLDKVDDIIYFKVYLEGEFPAGFKRLRNSTKEMLQEFHAYNKNIQYEFINPSASENVEERNAFYAELVRAGLKPTNLHSNNSGEKKQQIIFPGAVINGKGQEAAVDLLISQIGVSPEMRLNNSIEELEYNLINAINKIKFRLKPRVAFTHGHGELSKLELADAKAILSEFYIVDHINFNGHINTFTGRDDIDSLNPDIRNKYEAIIIAKPDSTFSEKEKFILDQFVMRGGKILWYVDGVKAEMDSIQRNSQTVTLSNDLNLDDLFFSYGCRLNKDLVLDLNANQIPIETGSVGGQPQYQFFPWYYFPVLTPDIEHPVVKNMNSVKTEFISSIDTINVEGIKKTALLKTSKYSRILNTPALIDLSIINEVTDEKEYSKKGQTIAVLLEGKFKSFYRNRLTDQLYNNPVIGFKETSAPNKMILVSDGDMIKNQIDYRSGYALPLGYDKYTRQSFGNGDFLLNAMKYLLDEDGLIAVRSKEIKLRMLDRTKVSQERIQWQLINILVPVIFVFILAAIQFRIRKNKYAKRK